MKTRMEKWASYREKIARTPDEKFKKKKAIYEETSPDEERALSEKALAGGAIILPGLPLLRPVPYQEARIRRIVFLVLKVLLAVGVVTLLALLWAFWVKG